MPLHKSVALRRASIAAAAFAVVAMAGLPTNAEILHWEPAGSGTPNGGSGNWNDSSLSWSTASDNTGTYKAWPNETGANADIASMPFPNTVATYTLTVEEDITVNQITKTGAISAFVTFDGPGKLTFDGSNAIQINEDRGTYTFNTVIDGDDGFNIDGHVSGTVILNAANLYSGLTLITDGTLKISNSSSLGFAGAGAGNDSAHGTRVTGLDFLDLNPSSGNLTLAEHININGAGTLRNLAGNNVLNSTIQVNGSGADSVIEVTAGSLTSTITANAVTSARVLEKRGNGTWTVNAANDSWNGTFEIIAGKFVLNGSKADSSDFGQFPVFVSSGATLAGDATIYTGSQPGTGAVNISTGAFVAPGNDNDAGTMSIFGLFNLSDNAELNFDLSDITTVGGGVNDLLALANHGSKVNPLQFVGGSSGDPIDVILNINLLDPTLAEGTYRLINYNGTVGGFGQFILGDAPTDDYDFTIDTSTAGQVNLVVTLIPEPGALSLLGVGALGLLGRRRIA
jgi:autotransporter-associated beta strand protein